MIHPGLSVVQTHRYQMKWMSNPALSAAQELSNQSRLPWLVNLKTAPILFGLDFEHKKLSPTLRRSREPAFSLLLCQWCEPRRPNLTQLSPGFRNLYDRWREKRSSGSTDRKAVCKDTILLEDRYQASNLGEPDYNDLANQNPIDFFPSYYIVTCHFPTHLISPSPSLTSRAFLLLWSTTS